jgi:tRNA (guanine37-N1)-methyltransferase
VRIDIVTIFPEYFAPLDLSLIGKARDKGLIDIRVHDLRSWTEDVHKTVDDTPYGGGAGMVMVAEPWGRALDDVLTPTSTLVIPTPSGSLFRQDTAKEWSAIEHLVFACGRYEGIDQRVIDHYSDTHDVRCVSMGDYVLNGGEVAVLAMVEAVGRLIPGVVGNPESLVEESHEDGFLEYPVYTKPAIWRGLAVPDVLLSGHHGEIRSWRAEQAKKRTLETRPDLLGGGD